MNQWDYTVVKGKALRDAINQSDKQLTIKCLLDCYKELHDQLTDEDKEWKGFDIEDVTELLASYDADLDDEDIDCYLEEFYNLCDELRAWITL